MFEIKNKEEVGRNARGMEVVEKNNHSFVMKKNKIANSLKSGEFVLVRNPDNPLGEAAIDESEDIVKLAKKFGLTGGGGASQTLDGVEQKFKTMGEMQGYLLRHPEDLLDIKRKIMMAHRADMQLPPLPPDQYLLGWVDVEGED